MRERVLPWDGRVEISGEKNKGTTVKVTIPTLKGGQID
jgi:signal transduction histidine kinase